MSNDFVLITDVGGLAGILNECDDLLQGDNGPECGGRTDQGFAETHRGRRPRRSDSFMIRWRRWMATSSHEHHGNRCTASNPRAAGEVLRQWSLLRADHFPRPVVSSLLHARLATQADVHLSRTTSPSRCFPLRSGVSVHPLHRLAVSDIHGIPLDVHHGDLSSRC